MAGEIDGPVVKIGADASKVESTLTGIKGKFDTLASSANSSLSGIGNNFDLSKVSQQIDQVSDKLKNLGSTLTVAALPFEAFGALAVKSFSDFEQNIGKIHTLLPDATKSAINKIGSDLKDFSAQFGADINKATQAYYDALSAGVSQDKALPFLQAAQKAGTAGMSDVSVAVDGLTSVLNAYQLGTEKATDVSDTMFQTVNLGKIEFDQLANNIGKVTPTASSFKVGFQDLGAAIAQITSLGVSPEETMTGLKNLIKDLGTDGSDLNVKFKELSGQGFTQFIQSGGSLVDVVRMLKDYSDKTGESFFNMTGSFESANTLAMLGGSAFDNYAGFLDKIKNSAGATDKAYSAMSDTMAFSMDQLKAQMQTMMIDVGGALAPSVKEFTHWLKDNSDEIKDFAVNVTNAAVPAIEKLFDIVSRLMSSFNNLDPNTKSLLATLLGGGIAAAAIGGPVMYATGTALGPVSSLISLLSKVAIPAGVSTEITAIGAAASTAAPEVSGLFTLLANPVTLAVGTGLIAAYVTNLGDFRDNVNDIVKDIGAAAKDISTGDYEEAGRDCAKAFGDGLETVTDLSAGIIQKFPNAVSGAGNFISGASETGEEFGKGIGEGAVKGIESMVGPVSDAIRLITSQNAAQNEIPNAIRGWFSGFTLTAEGKSLGQSFIDGFLSLNFGSMADPIKGAFTGAFDEGLSVVKQKMAEFYNTDLADLNSKLETAGIGGQYLASHGNGSQSSNTTGSYSGINTVSDQRGTQFWSNYASHNGAYGASASDIKTAVQSGTSAGISQAVSGAAAGKTDPISLLAADKTGGNYAGAQKMYASSELLKTKYDALAAAKDEEIAASKESTSATKTATSKVKTYADTASALADNSLDAGATFKVGSTEYKKTLDTVNGKLQYVAEEQSAAAELTRKQADLDKQNSEKAQKDQDSANEKLKTAKENYAKQLEKAQFDYDQAIKYADSSSDISTAKNTYSKRRDEILFNAKQDGIDLSDLNSNLKINSETVQNLNTHYTQFNQDLTKQLNELQNDRYQKLLKNPKADVTALDEKIQKITGQINSNKQAIDSANSAITKSTDAQNKYASASVAAGDKIVAQADKIANVNFREEGSTPDLLTKLGQSKADSVGKWTGYSADWYTSQLKSWLTSIADKVTRNDTLHGSSAGELEYDLQQQLTGSLKANTKGQNVSAAEIQATVDQFVSAYLKGNQQIISSAEQEKAKTSQIAISTTDYANALSKLNLSTEQQTKLQSELGSILSSSNTSLQGAAQYLDQYNSATQTNTQYSQDQISSASSLLKANEDVRKAQSDYNDTLQKTGDPAAAAAAANADLTQANKDLAAAGVTSVDDISKLPPAIQSLAQFAQAAINVISTSISKATGNVENTSKNIFTFSDAFDTLGSKTQTITDKIKSQASGLDQYITSSRELSGQFKADTSVPVSKLSNSPYTNQNVAGSAKAVDLNSDNIHCVFYDSNLKVPDSAVSKMGTDLSSANKSYIEQVMQFRGLNSIESVDTGQLNASALTDYSSALQNTGSILSSTIPTVNQNLDSVGKSLDNLASAAGAAVSKINDAISRANSILSSAISSVNNLQSGEFSGPQTTTQHYATGGPVTETGNAKVEEGEWILRRDQVRNLQTGGGNPIQLNVNMQNSKFGDGEMSKTLPKKIARETMLRLKRAGAI